MLKTEKFLWKLLWIIILSVVWNFVLPLVIAKNDNVYSSEEIKRKIPERAKETKDKFEKDEETRKAYETKIAYLTEQIKTSNDIENFVKAKEQYQNELLKLKFSVKIAPFNESQTLYHFVIITVCFCISIFLIAPEIKKSIKWKHVLYLVIPLHIIIQANSYLRNFFFYDQSRTVFSFLHFDLSPASFIFQELRVLFVSFLILYFCKQWIIYLDETIQLVKDWDKDSFSIRATVQKTDKVVEMFNTWQFNILSIGIAFVPWAFFYWTTTLPTQRENRYYLSAMLTPLGWIILWGLISAPLIYAFYKWTLFKSNALAFLVSKDNKKITKDWDYKEKDKVINFVKETSPLTNVQLIGASVASVVSFLLPLVNLLFK